MYIDWAFRYKREKAKIAYFILLILKHLEVLLSAVFELLKIEEVLLTL